MATAEGRADRFEQSFDIVCGSIGRGKAGRSASIVLDDPPTHAEMMRWRARAAAFNADARLDDHGVIIVQPRSVSESSYDARRLFQSDRDRLWARWADNRWNPVSTPNAMQGARPT